MSNYARGFGQFPGRIGPGTGSGVARGYLATGGGANMILQRAAQSMPGGSVPGLPGVNLNHTEGTGNIFQRLMAVPLPCVTHKGPQYGNYQANLTGAFIFSVYAASEDPAISIMSLTALNAMLRAHHQTEATMRAKEAQKKASLADAGLTMGRSKKRKAGEENSDISQNMLITTIEKFQQHVKFLGVCNTQPIMDQDKAAQRRAYQHAYPVAIQFSGINRSIRNVWGDVKPGESLFFHVTHLNNVNRTVFDRSTDIVTGASSSGIGLTESFYDWSDFGPLQVVPVVRQDGRSGPKFLGVHAQRYWDRVKNGARSLSAHNVPPTLGNEKFGPLFARSGSSEQALFDGVEPLRTIVDGDKVFTSNHWAPIETRITVEENGVKKSSTFLGAVIQDNVVIPLGRVINVKHDGSIPSDRMRANWLEDPSGEKLMREAVSKLEIGMMK